MADEDDDVTIIEDFTPKKKPDDDKGSDGDNTQKENTSQENKD